jgi:hypothetical protein
MKLPRRNFLHLAASAAALPVVSPITQAQAYPSRPCQKSDESDRSEARWSQPEDRFEVGRCL